MRRTSAAVALMMLVALLGGLTITPAMCAGDAFSAFRESENDPGLCREIARLTARSLQITVGEGGQPCAPAPVHPCLRRGVGVFVTLVEDGQVRGCMGAVDPVEETAAADITRAAALAATEDRRYPPLRPSELGKVVALVSIVGPRRRVQSLSQLDPLRLGLLVEGSGRGGVLLPGEALSAGRQVAGCRGKAGLSMRATATMYVFPTVVFDPSKRRHP